MGQMLSDDVIVLVYSVKSSSPAINACKRRSAKSRLIALTRTSNFSPDMIPGTSELLKPVRWSVTLFWKLVNHYRKDHAEHSPESSCTF